MRRIRVKLEDSKLEEEGQLKYRGSARLALEVIHLSGELDSIHVERLKRMFRKDGCRPKHMGNHILLLIDQPSLDVALSISGLSSNTLLRNTNNDYPELRLPSGRQVSCLHGKHRIQAGREFVSARERWWVADLYLAGKLCIW